MVGFGGKLIIRDGIGMTMHGDAPELDYWRLAYAATNPSDTDGGAHPQNLLRLLSRSVWEDVRIEAHLRIDDDHVSASPNRDGSNGLLLMTRYRDSGTLYYAGMRVDGTAVISDNTTASTGVIAHARNSSCCTRLGTIRDASFSARSLRVVHESIYCVIVR